MAISTIDELRAALDAASNDSERLAATLTLVEVLRDSDLHESISLASKSVVLAERLTDEHRMAEGLRLMGLAYREVGSYQQSLDQLQRARTVSQRLGDMVGVARATGEIGIVHKCCGEYDKALEHYQSALALAEESVPRYHLHTVRELDNEEAVVDFRSVMSRMS